MPNVVLITGVSRALGAELAAVLADDPAIERVIGVDAIEPSSAVRRRLGRTEFVRADIRNPLLGRAISSARVDTVVHLPLLGPSRLLTGLSGEVAPRELAVLGTMQLLAGCQKSDTVARVVVRSTTAVYGSSPRDPAVFTEQMHAAGAAPSGYAREAVEVEGYVRGFTRRRPDIEVTIARFASIIGPGTSGAGADSPLGRYLAMPVVPTSLGFDPRLQLLHFDDALAVLRRAAYRGPAGVFNVAGDGALPLSLVLRRAGRLRLPVPAPAISLVGALVRNSGALEVSAEQASFLNYGRVVDTTRLKERFGYHPVYSSDAALDSYLDALGRLPITPQQAADVALRLAGGIGRRILAATSAARGADAASTGPGDLTPLAGSSGGRA